MGLFGNDNAKLNMAVDVVMNNVAYIMKKMETLNRLKNDVYLELKNKLADNEFIDDLELLQFMEKNMRMNNIKANDWDDLKIVDVICLYFGDKENCVKCGACNKEEWIHKTLCNNGIIKIKNEYGTWKKEN